MLPVRVRGSVPVRGRGLVLLLVAAVVIVVAARVMLRLRLRARALVVLRRRRELALVGGATRVGRRATAALRSPVVALPVVPPRRRRLAVAVASRGRRP
jgi:hypothetical protein